MSEADPVSLREADAFLRQRYGARVEGLAELSGGDWSRAFSFRLADQDLVVRFGRYGEDFAKDREAMALGGPDLPVPAVLEIGEALGAAYAISERCFGIFLDDLDAAQWGRVLPAILRALDALRQAPAPADDRDAYPKAPQTSADAWGAQLLQSLVDRPGGRVSGWREKLACSSELDELFVAAKRELERLVAGCPTVRHVLHRDLLNRNVLVSNDATRLVGVFDWGCSMVGDFLYEIAWFDFWAPWHPGLAAIDLPSKALEHYRATGVEVPLFAQRLRCYNLHIGLEHLAYLAFAGREEDLFAVARRTREVLDSPAGGNRHGARHDL